MFSKTPPTIRFQLTRLVIASVLPVWVLSGFLVFHVYSDKREQINHNMLESARSLTMVVDRELTSVQAALSALATSPSFAAGDFAGVQRQAMLLLRSYPGADIIVADATGQQMVNSFLPDGTPLPQRKNLEAVRRIFATGKPVVGDLFYGAITKRPLIGIDVPVMIDGKVAYDLAMTFPSDCMTSALLQQRLPAGGYATILDSRQVVVARSHDPQRFVGTNGSPRLRQALALAPEGAAEWTNLNGVPAYVTFCRSSLSNWSVVVGVSRASVRTEMYRWAGWASAGAALISLFGIALAVGYARRITRAIQSLVEPALCIGRGGAAPAAGSNAIRETAEVAAALVQASDLLQKRHEELQQSERRYSALFANKISAMAHCRVITDEAGRPVDYWILQVNEAYERILGISKADIEGRRVREVFPGVENYSFDYIGSLGKIGLEGGELTSETILEATGQHLSIYAYSPSPGEFTVIFTDVTERKRVEVEREQFFKFFTASADLMCIADPDGAFKRTNPAFSEVLGYSEAELVSRPFIEFVHPEDREQTLAEMKRQQEVGYSLDFENRYLCKDGSLRWLSWRVIFNSDDQTSYATARDITERREMESRLRASEAHYRLLTEDVSDVVWKLDGECRFTYVSPADQRLRGYRADEVIGRTIFEMTTAEGAASIGEKFRLRREAELQGTRTGTLTLELQQRCSDGRLIWTEMLSTPSRDPRGRITGYHGITRDITERKQAARLEQQLLHAQKLESLGVLAGGIAHDFNNILMAVLGNAELGMMSLDAGSPVLVNLRNIEQAAARAADLTKQMLAYSGKGRFVIENLDLNGLTEKMLQQMEPNIAKGVQVKLDLDQALPPVEADATQLRQLLMNLVANGSEAIGERGGCITISTGSLECDRNDPLGVWPDENLGEGRYVYLKVADTGCGMGQETKARLFDPFFSTKFTGRGLGMSAALGIVKGHKGAIRVCSEPGQGATFTVLLPASGRPAETADRESGSDVALGSGTVLLVDDEETVRSIGSEMLKALGFTPITANDGVEAVGIFQGRSDIAFVILDLTMPRMGGEECFRELRRLDPKVKVIMSSGYNEQEVTAKFAGRELSGFMQKPYKLSELRDAVMMVADRP